MAKPVVISETPINLSMIKEELAKIKKRDKELNFRANKVEEHLGQFSPLERKKADELYKKIDGLKVPRLRDIHIHKIIDILPTTGEDVKLVLQGYTVTVKQEHMKKVAETVKAFIK